MILVEVLVGLAWWTCGMGGGILLWQSWKISFPDKVGSCPTRGGALLIFLTGVGGVLALCMGLIVFLICFFEGRASNPDSWWRRPIC
mgnify:CR=1 FL=1